MKVVAYGMFSTGVCSAHCSGAAARIEKYIANSAAKNMSSLESHTIVPTLTMLGRVSEWIRLLSMAGAAVTRSLLPPIRPAISGGPIRARSPDRSGPVRRPRPSLESVQLADDTRPPPRGRGTLPPPFTVARVFTETRLDSWLALVLLVAAGLYLYGVYRLRQRGDRWPVGPHRVPSSARAWARIARGHGQRR